MQPQRAASSTPSRGSALRAVPHARERRAQPPEERANPITPNSARPASSSCARSRGRRCAEPGGMNRWSDRSRCRHRRRAAGLVANIRRLVSRNSARMASEWMALPLEAERSPGRASRSAPPGRPWHRAPRRDRGTGGGREPRERRPTPPCQGTGHPRGARAAHPQRHHEHQIPRLHHTCAGRGVRAKGRDNRPARM